MNKLKSIIAITLLFISSAFAQDDTPIRKPLLNSVPNQAPITGARVIFTTDDPGTATGSKVYNMTQAQLESWLGFSSASSSQNSLTDYNSATPPVAPPVPGTPSLGDLVIVRYPNDYVGWMTYNGTTWDTTFIAAPTPNGYFMSPTGLPGNLGTQASPWDILSAMETQTIPPGETLWALPGTYPARDVAGAGSYPSPSYAGQTENTYRMMHPNVTVKPYGATYLNPYPAILQSGIEVVGNGGTVEGFRLDNPTAIPIAEPTIAGSPWPGFPAAAPAGWAYWASGGTVNTNQIAASSNITIRYNIASRGAGGISSFQSSGLVLEGNVAYNTGWDAVDRTHGHGYYLQNPAVAPTGTNTFYANVASTYQDRIATVSGRESLIFYATNPDVQNWNVNESYIKGTLLVRSDNGIVRDMSLTNLIVEAAKIGTSAGAASGDNSSFGRPGNADTAITLSNYTIINGRKVLDNNLPITATQTLPIRQIKTRAAWYVTQLDQPPGSAVLEAGTHIDSPPTVLADEYRVNIMADTRQARVFVMDYGNNGSVSVNLSTNGFATTADSYALYHYRDVTTPVASGSLSGGTTINVSIVDTNSTTGLLDTSDAFLVFLQ